MTALPALPSLATLAIGTVPFTDIDRTLDLIARTCPLIPVWPQMSRLSPWEGMVLDAVDGLPALEVQDADRGQVRIRSTGREEALTSFYEHFLAADWNHFAVPETSARGWAPFLARAQADPRFGPEFLKAQIIGPISFGQAIRTPDDKILLDDPELGDTVVKGLGAKAAWLAGRIRALGRTPLIFIDEPGLAGYGSAFSSLSAEQVVGALDEMVEIIKSDGPTLVGIHVCANTDWGLITRTGIDVINFDAHGFLDHFLLYPTQIRAFLERGGYVAWGLVPTLNYAGQTAAFLADHLRTGWRNLTARGLDPDLIRTRSLISPACGLGVLDEAQAWTIMELLPQVAELLTK